jgi:hypothetical protein
MIRVLATIKRSQYASSFTSEQSDLQNWIEGIHNGIYPHLVCMHHHVFNFFVF